MYAQPAKILTETHVTHQGSSCVADLFVNQVPKGPECRISLLYSREPAELGQKSHLFHASRKCTYIHTQRLGRYGSTLAVRLR